MAFYAVKQGRQTGVFKTWDECLKQVKGYSGADYKKFNNLEDAKDYSGATEIERENAQYAEDLYSGKVPDPCEDMYISSKTPVKVGRLAQVDDRVMFYVDGSYNIKTRRAGYGLVQVINNKATFRDYGSSYPGEDTTSRNVLGEIKGAIKALELSVANDLQEITLCYDYVGIEAWVTGKWKSKNLLTQFYVETMQDLMTTVKVNFVKIAAHSNNTWNDEADRLAKIGAGI